MRPSVNTLLSEQIVTNVVDLMRYSEHERKRVLAMLMDIAKTLEQEILSEGTLSGKRRLTALIKQANDTIATGFKGIDEHMRGVAYGAAEASAVFAQRALDRMFEGRLTVVGLAPETLSALSKDTMIFGAPSSAWWSRQANDLQFSFMRQVRQGFYEGQSVSDIATRIIGTPTGKTWQFEHEGVTRTFKEYTGGILDASRRQAEALVRTSVQQVANEARLEMYRKNDDIIDKIQWVATLDSRTTPMCRARDGLLYTLDGEPIGHTYEFNGGPPIHWACRSTTVPVTKTWKELGLDAPELKSTRASADGQVPDTVRYEDWLAKQSPSVQKDILGPGRFELYQSGKIGFSDLVDQRGNPLTLAQIRERVSA